jgi:hypothetical protein
MKRTIKVIGVAVVLLVVAFLLFPFVLQFVYGPFWESRTRKESIRILAKTDARKELASACSLFLTFPDGSWIAIRYRDLHGSGHSTTLVRDSGGQWFESGQHFCALFDGYRSFYELYRLEREVGEPEEIHVSSAFEGIHAVATSPSLGSAREALIKMGFRPLDKKDAQQAGASDGDKPPN